MRKNKVLEKLIVGSFELPQDIESIRSIVKELPGNSVLRSIMIQINAKTSNTSDYVAKAHPELNCDPRISWKTLF